MDKLIPVVEIKDVNETEKTLSALRAGGVNCAEITFRTACAAEAISLGVKLFPDMNRRGNGYQRSAVRGSVKRGREIYRVPGAFRRSCGNLRGKRRGLFPRLRNADGNYAGSGARYNYC